MNRDIERCSVSGPFVLDTIADIGKWVLTPDEGPLLFWLYICS